MKQIPLTGKNNEFALVDDEDFELLMRHKWQRNKYGAIRDTKIGGRKGKRVGFKMHRVVMNCPQGMVVDHIDHNVLNNQKSNLRICTLAQNSANKRKTTKPKSSRFKGVNRHKNGSWMAKIWNGTKKIHIKTFRSEEDAARAYDAAARQQFGEFACTNF